MSKLSTGEVMHRAWRVGVVVPAFNIPYLPMMEPVVRALRECDAFGLIQVARLEWIKFEAISLKAVSREYQKVKDEGYTRLHLDHCPVIDEDNLWVDVQPIIADAIDQGFESVMIDGSRLSLEENIARTREIVELAHGSGVPVEAELGAVMGHEEGPLPPYEELFRTGKGFTDPDEARRFVKESGADWLSVAIGSVHGAISPATKDKAKIQARLSIEQLDRIREAVGIPLVLHGGTGIEKGCLQDSFRHGIAKINIATAIRQPYERAAKVSIEAGQQAVYEETVALLRDELAIAGTAAALMGER